MDHTRGGRADPAPRPPLLPRQPNRRPRDPTAPPGLCRGERDTRVTRSPAAPRGSRIPRDNGRLSSAGVLRFPPLPAPSVRSQRGSPSPGKGVPLSAWVPPRGAVAARGRAAGNGLGQPPRSPSAGRGRRSREAAGPWAEDVRQPGAAPGLGTAPPRRTLGRGGGGGRDRAGGGCTRPPPQCGSSPVTSSSPCSQCQELRGFIRPLAELLEGLRRGRYDRGGCPSHPLPYPLPPRHLFPPVENSHNFGAPQG